MSWAKDLADEAAAWALIGGKPSAEEIRVQAMPLVEFLELISLLDFSFRYTKGDPKMRGVEKRHEILKLHIAKLKQEKK